MGKYEKKTRPSGGKYQRRREKTGAGKLIAVLLGIAVLLAIVILLFDGEEVAEPETAATEEAVQVQTTEAIQVQEPVETVQTETTQPPTQEPEETQAAWFDYLFDRIAGKEEETEPTLESEEQDTQPLNPGPVGTKVQRMTYMEMASGDLVLVNETYGFPAGMASVTTLHDKASALYHVEDINLSVQAHVVEPLNRWLGAFSTETGNRELLVSAGYRGQEADIPEFHTGLAIALDTYHIGTTMDGEEGYEQLAEMAWQYGFIRRWPADKAELTGVSGKQWHFRYVGIPHSVIMAEEALCLEEYLEYLRTYTLEKGALETEYDGAQYEIYFCEGLEITVPLNRKYTVSGNNVDGFIVTIEMNG